MVIGAKFSSDEIEDIEDAAVVTGFEAIASWDKSRVIVSALPNQNVDYQLEKVGDSYVLIAADGSEIGRVDHVVDIISLLEAVLRNPNDRTKK